MDHVQNLIHIPRDFCLKPRLQMCHDLSSSGHHPEVAKKTVASRHLPVKKRFLWRVWPILYLLRFHFIASQRCSPKKSKVLVKFLSNPRGILHVMLLRLNGCPVTSPWVSQTRCAAKGVTCDQWDAKSCGALGGWVWNWLRHQVEYYSGEVHGT